MTGVNILKGIKITIAGKMVLAALTIVAVLIVLFTGDMVSCSDNRIMPMLQGPVVDIEKWSDDRPLRVAVYPGGGFAAGILENNGLKANRESKFYKNHRLLVEFHIVENPETCMKLLADNSVDITWVDLQRFTVMYSRYRTINPVAFMQYSWSAGEHAIFSRGIISVSGLKERKALCVESGVSHFLALYLLRCNSLTGNEVKWKFTYTDADADSLFNGGGYPVCAVSRLIGSGNKNTVIASTRDADRLIPGLFIGREQTLYVNAPHIQKFIKGWMEGVLDLRSNREPAEKILASAYQVSDDIAKLMLDCVFPVDINDNMEFFGMKGKTYNGFSELYDLAEDIWSEAGYPTGHGFSNFARDTSLLTSVISGSVVPVPKSVPSAINSPGNKENLKPVCASTVIDFEKDSLVFNFRMKNRIKDFAMKGARFSRLPIRIDARTTYPGELINAYRWMVRIRNILDVLEEFGIDKNRCFFNTMDTVPAADQGSAQTAAVLEKVSLTLVREEPLQK